MSIPKHVAQLIAEMAATMQMSVVCAVIANPFAIDAMIRMYEEAAEQFEKANFGNPKASPTVHTLNKLRSLKVAIESGKSVEEFIGDHPQYWMSDLLDN